ncbi:MAG TPA: FIST N-terminal domain-containing protein [Planctomycetota bacterium]|nr:FIST N-terminal domain-containing protein [Planctomycetota bacterium]
MPFRFATGMSTEKDAVRAADEAAGKAAGSLGGSRSDLAFLFVSPLHAPSIGEIGARVREHLRPATLLGCAANGVIADEREIEQGPAVAVWAAAMPGAAVQGFAARVRVEGEEARVDGFPEFVPGPEGSPSVLLVVDPFSFPADAFLRALAERRPDLPVLGGMASGANAPGETRLLLDEEVLEEGAVGALFAGPVEMRAVVSQGCRPIGRALVVTKGEGNVVQELGGKPALEQLEEVLASLDERDRVLARRALHVGLVIDEYRSTFERGDFLVRNLLGADPRSGALVVGDRVRRGQTIQFHVRDAETADEDLRALLEREVKRRGGSAPAGALLFTCNGRGTNLFPGPDHDASAVRGIAGAVPLAGFFAAGEIGPIGARNFLHGYTASLALFYEGARPGHRGTPGL